MARYIDADQMISGIRNALDKNKDIICSLTHETFEMFIAMLEKEPTADVEEVKHGEWRRNEPNPEQMKEFHDMGIGKAIAISSIFWTCSCCGTWGTPRYKYCPNCGAKMDKTKKGN